MSSAISKNNSSPGFLFWFERDHDVMPSTRWLQSYGTQVCIGLCVSYLIGIYAGQYVMRNYQRKEMKLVLILWNVICALFAMMGSFRMIPELVSSLYYNGFRDSVCNADYPFRDPTGFWTEMFMWSKAVELIDTAFLVLRKRPIIFLHWYHHVTVMMFTWHASKEHSASGRWFVTMNFTVHALMYTYYALRIIGFNRLPKFIPMTLTALQLSQMVVGCYISASVFWLKNSGYDCHQSYENLYFCFLIYFTYGILFAKFFWDTYISKPSAHQMSVRAMEKKME